MSHFHVEMLPHNMSHQDVRPLNVTTSLTVLASSRRQGSLSQHDIIGHFLSRRHTFDATTSHTVFAKSKTLNLQFLPFNNYTMSQHPAKPF